LLYHSTLSSRVIKKKKTAPGPDVEVLVPGDAPGIEERHRGHLALAECKGAIQRIGVLRVPLHLGTLSKSEKGKS